MGYNSVMFNEIIVEKILPYLFTKGVFRKFAGGIYPSDRSESEKWFPEFEKLYDYEKDPQVWTNEVTELYKYVLHAERDDLLYQPGEYLSRGEFQRSELISALIACARLKVVVDQIPVLGQLMWDIVITTPFNGVSNELVDTHMDLVAVTKLDQRIKKALSR